MPGLFSTFSTFRDIRTWLNCRRCAIPVHYRSLNSTSTITFRDFYFLLFLFLFIFESI